MVYVILQCIHLSLLAQCLWNFALQLSNSPYSSFSYEKPLKKEWYCMPMKIPESTLITEISRIKIIKTKAQTCSQLSWIRNLFLVPEKPHQFRIIRVRLTSPLIWHWNTNSITHYCLNSGAVSSRNLQNCLNMQCLHFFPLQQCTCVKLDSHDMRPQKTRYHNILDVAQDTRIQQFTNIPNFLQLCDKNQYHTSH